MAPGKARNPFASDSPSPPRSQPSSHSAFSSAAANTSSSGNIFGWKNPFEGLPDFFPSLVAKKARQGTEKVPFITSPSPPPAPEAQLNAADDEAVETVEAVEAVEAVGAVEAIETVETEPQNEIPERSRSVETDISLFGGPLSNDKQSPADGSPSMEEEQIDAISVSSVSSTQTYAQIGVEWTTAEFDYFKPYPAWSCEPEAQEVVELLKEVISPLEEYRVCLLHLSSYNRYFAVERGENNENEKNKSENYIVKLTVPVCPARKTASEVATMRWTKAMTPLPLPDVVQSLYSASANNPTGCEWILMRRVPGRPLFECWREMELPRKRRVVEQLADYTIRVFDLGLDAIASLYPARRDDPDQRPEFGAMATMPFFWNGRHEKAEKKGCGPYETYREWAFDRLDLAEADAQSVLPKIQSPFVRRISWRIIAVTAKLKELHDVLFPSPRNPSPVGLNTDTAGDKKEELLKGDTADEPISLLSDSEDEENGTNIETNDSFNDGNNDENDHSDGDEAKPFECEEKTMMWHTNLSLDNIFVDETGVITGILNWECIAAIPRSVACQLPAFLLEGHERTQKPHVKDYWTFSDTIPPPSPTPSLPSRGGNENEYNDCGEEEEQRGRPRHRQRPQPGPTPAYWQAYREWELTTLRRHFERIMKDRSLGWHMFYKHHGLKRDFETAVQYCDDPLMLDVVEEWIGSIEKAVEEAHRDDKGWGGGNGGGMKKRGLGVWSLERRIARGRKAPAGHNQRT